ncbi:MAG: hypothetical protein AUJ92_11340 [Armatimonadetes bacterium CG2_30_59_28]|nr:hypothetical protein [Armatimonadota bacterium]OIO93907.1 MAG: hypothetical protein AUJ92_11340 [Armatimonadetes bacterium CG2_30_59_28]PIU64815.1 MAG: hypothetical protein COS85_11120 [Armatimonadetes bacterium CG07_land_8_20_14_0_80_59_28]PIX38398.1 MAG: hypothetical protein COZ56_20520 [Armatimonadetes bacterium CG_4_8_14_3_um_filter_58_9]PJB72661.1 MAG: hypothetical protein CO095_06585 [Armatimonadetes bacterium CG_4_9_14_3_um_filter_58_7]
MTTYLQKLMKQYRQSRTSAKSTGDASQLRATIVRATILLSELHAHVAAGRTDQASTTENDLEILLSLSPP